MTETTTFSPREFRHVTNRLLHARGAKRNLVNPVRDVLLFAEAAGFDSLTELERSVERLAECDGSVHAVDDTELTAALQPGYYVAPAVLDLLSLSAKDHLLELTITQVTGGNIFSCLKEYAALRGVKIEIVTATEQSATITYRRCERFTATAPLDAEGPAMRHALIDGMTAPKEQFWRLFRASDDGLTADFDQSWLHAGSQLYDADGNVIGEEDDENYTYIRSWTPDATEA